MADETPKRTRQRKVKQPWETPRSVLLNQQAVQELESIRAKVQSQVPEGYTVSESDTICVCIHREYMRYLQSMADASSKTKEAKPEKPK